MPVLPTFSKLESGVMKIDRCGTIMFTFWPAIGEWKYDWEKRLKFALSPTEVGAVISLPPGESWQVRKSLSIKANEFGYFISLSVVNNVTKSTDRLSVPVTAAEFAVVRTAFSFTLQRLMGWDHYLNKMLKRMDQNPSRVVSRLVKSEWDR